MNLDITFCVADCTNSDCERNLNFEIIPTGRDTLQADLSDNCPMYEEYDGSADDLDSEEELDFND